MVIVTSTANISQMQDYGAGVSSNNADIRESSEGKDRTSQQSESFQTHHSITYQNHYGKLHLQIFTCYLIFVYLITMIETEISY